MFAHWITVNYRQSYGLHASNGICFNHESPRRGKRFVTRKISRAVAKITQGKQDILYLGNLDAKRDWGYAPEYVEGMWQMVNSEEPGDYVLATGETHTVRSFVEHAFDVVGVNIEWKDEGVDEVGYDAETDEILVKVDPRYFGPNEVDTLIGDPSKAEKNLGWSAETGFEELVELMVKEDIKTLEEGGDIALDYLQ